MKKILIPIFIIFLFIFLVNANTLKAVGDPCLNPDECGSGVCQGSRCRAMDILTVSGAPTCTPVCSGITPICDTTTDPSNPTCVAATCTLTEATETTCDDTIDNDCDGDIDCDDSDCDADPACVAPVCTAEGQRIDVDGDQAPTAGIDKYCDASLQPHLLKAAEDSCNLDYECESSLCSPGGECLSYEALAEAVCSFVNPQSDWTDDQSDLYEDLCGA